MSCREGRTDPEMRSAKHTTLCRALLSWFEALPCHTEMHWVNGHDGAEVDGTFAAWGVRGLWGRTRRRGSYCDPQISQGASRRSSAWARETGTDDGRGCQSFQKGKARVLRSHAHTPTTGVWVIHERIFSMLEAQILKTTIVSIIRGQETTRTKRTRTERHLEKDATIRDLLF